MSVTPETTVARILAEQLAAIMARGMSDATPDVGEIPPSAAQFAIDTPFGRVRVDVTVIA